MATTTRPSLTRLAAGMLVPLALAGTCLAAPALAATSATATTDASAAAETAAASDATTTEDTVLAAGGIQVTVPGSWSSIALGDTLKVAVSEDDSTSASIVVLDAETLSESGYPADDATKQQAFFDESAEETADAMGGTVAATITGDLDEGVTAYMYIIDGSADEENPLIVAQAYIPMADGTMTMLNVTADLTTEGVSDTLTDVLGSISIADTTTEAEAADTAASEVELGQTVEAGGLVIGVPSDMEIDEDLTADGDGELDLTSSDGMLFLSIIPDIFAGEDLTADEDLEEIVNIIAAALGGEAMDFTMLNNNGVSTKLYAFVLEADDVKLLGSLGFTEVADGTTTCVMGVCLNDGTTDHGAVLDAIYASIALSE